MSTRPHGPPHGPLHGGAKPGPPVPRRRRWWRSLPALVGAGAVVVAIAVALLVISMGGGRQDVGTPAAARGLARRVTLSPSDWGAGFVRGAAYENTEMAQGLTDRNCAYLAQPIAGALAALQRTVGTPDRTVVAYARLVVYRDAASARADIARLRADTDHCRTEHDAAGKARWEDVHAVDVPALRGFDEVATEEGHRVTDEKGRTADNYYTYLSGRKGKYLMQSYVVRTAKRDGNRSAAAAALSLMLSRL
ncbi:hypothetical protein [Streptomyces sp. NPDC046197]|uniref:hypothetical protein n=1 Tax=Streptomyces sp. NPDC046197 TaxID=3154337 RepID=UPI0033C5D586